MAKLRTPADIGATIRERRRRQNLDQQTLARMVGVSRQWIVEAERGKPRAALDLVLRTLGVLGITLTTGDEPEVQAPRTQPHVDLNAIIDAARRPRP